ncbi:MAG: dihydroorotase [Spirochaetota bacterium]
MIVFKKVRIPRGDFWLPVDVVVAGGLYAHIGKPGGVRVREKARIVEGEGMYLIPAPIDPHVHVREPGDDYKEDWVTCSKSALKGGIGTIFDMPNNRVPIVDSRTLMEKREIALKKSFSHFGLYIALTDKNGSELMDPLVQTGICGVKVYMHLTTGDLLVKSEDALMLAFEQPRPVLFHTGGPEGLERVLYLYKKAFQTHNSLPVIYLCHLSTVEEVRLIRKWKREYSNIVAEVTPHHLFLTHESYRGYRGVLPPLAGQSDVEALWEGIKDGNIDILGSDHAPHTIEEKQSMEPPAGFPGLETSLPLIFQAHMDGKLSLGDFSRLMRGKAIEIFNLKEERIIQEGGRADCVVMEEGEFSVGDGGYETKCGWSPFHGWRLRWKPVMTLLNGNVVYERGVFFKYPVFDLCCEKI